LFRWRKIVGATSCGRPDEGTGFSCHFERSEKSFLDPSRSLGMTTVCLADCDTVLMANRYQISSATLA